MKENVSAAAAAVAQLQVTGHIFITPTVTTTQPGCSSQDWDSQFSIIQLRRESEEKKLSPNIPENGE